ncbi:MAG: ABC transporter substrate-binding protein [Solirubrobacteraceae bacterium]
MSRSMWRTMLALVAVFAALFVAACGSEDSGSDSDSGTPAQTQEESGGSATEELFAGSATDNLENPEDGVKGGKITILSGGDVDFMDPGKTYYTYAIGIMSALHRGLYAYEPGSLEPTPDLAAGPPEISEDGKTVTVKLREGVMYSDPVKRAVTSADVKYAIERAFTANVANGYAPIYFGDLVGAPEEPGPYKPIEGLETPDDQTLVMKLTEGTGAAAAGALALPISIPVPQEYAEKYDKESPSTYGEGFAVYTGPYMVESDAQGKAVGYVPGKSIHIIRNPNYENVDDFRPAFIDEYDIQAGNEDAAVATRRVLGGESLMLGELEPPASQLERLLEEEKPQLSAVPGGGWRMISLDTSRPPFDDIDVRKAVIAGFDRNAVRQQRGGEALGAIAQHMIPPGLPGFEESGGFEGFAPEEFDWLQNPAGDPDLSAEYFKAAGFASGKYEGPEELLIVGDAAAPDGPIAEITEQQLQEMGFKTKLRLVTRDTMFTKFCNVPDSEVHVCPSVGWAQDFADPQTMIDPTFNGANIPETSNSNWPELDDPAANEAIEAAKLETEPGPRAQAWADANEAVVAQAPGITYMWDYQSLAASPNVRGVQNGYSTTWDLNFTSLRP